MTSSAASTFDPKSGVRLRRSTVIVTLEDRLDANNSYTNKLAPVTDEEVFFRWKVTAKGVIYLTKYIAVIIKAIDLKGNDIGFISKTVTNEVCLCPGTMALFYLPNKVRITVMYIKGR
jgi:hypothetical protein